MIFKNQMHTTRPSNGGEREDHHYNNVLVVTEIEEITMNGGGSSAVSNSGLSMDVKNGSDLGLEFDSTIGDQYSAVK